MGAEFCQRLFLHLLRLSYDFIFQFVNMVYHIDWFAYIEESLHPWNKPNLIMVYEFLMSCWTLFPKILLRIFASMFISDNWPVVFFLCVVFVWFWYQGNCGLVEWVWKCSILCSFLKEFRRIGISFSLNVWQNCPVKPSGPGLLFFGRFFDHSFNFSNWIGWFVISISSWFSLGRLNFSKIYSFLPGCPFYCHIVVHNSLL